MWWLVPAVTPPAPQPGQLEALLSTLPDTDGHYGEASHHLFSLDTDGHSCVPGLGVVKGVVYGQVELVTVEKMGRGGVAVAAKFVAWSRRVSGVTRLPMFYQRSPGSTRCA